MPSAPGLIGLYWALGALALTALWAWSVPRWRAARTAAVTTTCRALGCPCRGGR